MLRTESLATLPRVGAGTRSVRRGASTQRPARAVRNDAVEIQKNALAIFRSAFVGAAKRTRYKRLNAVGPKPGAIRICVFESAARKACLTSRKM